MKLLTLDRWQTISFSLILRKQIDYYLPLNSHEVLSHGTFGKSIDLSTKWFGRFFDLSDRRQGLGGH